MRDRKRPGLDGLCGGGKVAHGDGFRGVGAEGDAAVPWGDERAPREDLRAKRVELNLVEQVESLRSEMDELDQPRTSSAEDMVGRRSAAWREVVS